MRLGKNELRLIGFLGVLLYAFIFYKFAWVPSVPYKAEVEAKMAAAAREKASLEEDLKNLDANKMELTVAEASDERIDEYLMNSANIVDSLEYVDKLVALIGKNISALSIAKPEERYATVVNNPLQEDTDLKTDKSGGKVYYEIRLDFKAHMTYNNALELVRYIEGGTRRMKITKFAVRPLEENAQLSETVIPQADLQESGQNVQAAAGTPAQGVENAAASGVQPANGERLFEMNMTVSMFSVNLRASDRMYEYSRHKLNRFLDGSGILFAPGTGGETGETSAPIDISGNLGTEDIIIKQRSYLVAGENLQIYGADRTNGIIRVKTNKPADVRIDLGKTSYTINTADTGNQSLRLTGGLPDRDPLTIYIGVDMPAIKENERIRLNVSILNNSDKRVNVSLYDLQKRVKLLDRNGNEIFGASAVEKLSII